MRARLCLSILLALTLLTVPACRGFQGQSDALVSGFDETSWDKLGERRVGLAAKRDVIHVTPYKGRYRRLMVVIPDSVLEMNDVVVTYAEGQAFSPATRYRFAEGSRSNVIELPDGRRGIRKVEFRYRSKHAFSGFAAVELWGQR